MPTTMRSWVAVVAVLCLAACQGADAEWTMPKRGPRGDATCAGGKCQKYASCELRVCTGLCREYYPQVRKFLKETLPKYVHVREIPDGSGALSPTMYFFNHAGREIEKLEVNGMFVHEMVEELEKRGIYPSNSRSS